MNLYLIGYRGCGKSTIAPLVAEALSASGPLWETIDADDAVEEIAGISIAEIFSEFGEAKFRKLESEVIQSLSEQNQLVVSLGGGAPIIELNRCRIRETGKSIWLRAEADLLCELRSLLCVAWRDHRVVGAKTPLCTVLFRGQAKGAA